ncbi:MAG: PD-(D/E)XK nuclease family protein, partial [Oscillospiraceae bacterium]|nr:PD-(D/E)XK nuclease family protein [Oscillospiraceae bacterium]
MIELILGRGGSGKTLHVFREIGRRASDKKRSLLLIPEQYSHEAERLLCTVCGDAASIYAEVLSFSRLSSRVLDETGGSPGKALDAGGRVLLMNLALDMCASRLKCISRRRRVEFIEGMLDAYDEFRSACISPGEIARAGEELSGSLGRKLSDFALVFETYDALIPEGMYDPASRLDLMAERTEMSTVGDNETVYIDGFTDFTAQESAVIEALIAKGADIVCCLSCDGLSGTEPIFTVPRKTGAKLLRIGKRRGAECKTVLLDREKSGGSLEVLERCLLTSGDEGCPEADGQVELFKCGSKAEECELAAAKVRELTADAGMRYREIGIVAKGWGDYECLLDSLFTSRGIPVQFSRRSELLQKPAIVLILSALDIINNGWDRNNVFKYLKTGMGGTSPDETDMLENYVLRWDIRGKSMWAPGYIWRMPPDDKPGSDPEQSREMLERLNKAKAKAGAPLFAFAEKMEKADTASEKVMALWSLISELELAAVFRQKAEEYGTAGSGQQADEYRQLWDILVSALEQMYGVLADREMDDRSFAAILKLLLSQYDIGTIPSFFDSVNAGDMDRMKRRGLKCLIILGASDDRLPGSGTGGGVISENDRDRLAEYGMDLGGTSEELYERDLYSVYSSITLPSERLIMSWSEQGGGDTRPSYIFERVRKLLDLSVQETDSGISTWAETSCFELAARSGRDGTDPTAAAAAEYMLSKPEYADKLRDIWKTADSTRGALSKMAVESLYGNRVTLSATKVDRFHSCRFSYFLRYGLKAMPRRQSRFTAMDSGAFLHYLLENVVKDSESRGGVAKLTQDECRRLTRKYTREYIEKALPDFEERDGRFKYLFRRLASDAEQIVLDMSDELRCSD